MCTNWIDWRSMAPRARPFATLPEGADYQVVTRAVGALAFKPLANDALA